MTTGVDFAINPSTGDFDVVNGDLVLTQTIRQEAFQRIRHTLNVWQGEWWKDTLFGTPYKQSILTKTTKAAVDAEFLRIIRSDVQVVDVLEFESSLNRNTRFYDVRFVVSTLDGTSLNFIGTTDPAGSEFIYPTPGTGFSNRQCTFVDDAITYSNKLYELIHITLPPWTSADYWGGT